VTEQTSHKIISGDAAILAKRYAGALFELASADKAVDAVANDVRALAQLLYTDPTISTIVKDPRLNRTQLIKLAQTLAQSLNAHKLTGKFLSLVADNRRLNLLAPITQAFLTELGTRNSEHSATVRTAEPLSPQQQERLAEKLATLAGGKVKLETLLDKSLIGGLTVQIGSRLIDASIRNKLQRLERQLKSEAA
jgi:F-type H+-transporting ATPase subunit delta